MTTHRYLPTLMLAGLVAVVAPACAAQTYGYRYPSGDVYRDVERRAYDRGLRDGADEARNDVRHGRSFSFERHSEYRDADNGYHRGDGEVNFYRRSYRQGFQSGYTEIFRRDARSYDRGVYGGPVSGGPVWQDPRVVNPRGGYVGSPAAQNGYRDGVEAGRNDARDRHAFDPRRASRYREGDHDYNDRYGSRDNYKRDYRDAFQRGYEEGYGRR